jgi:TP901 family phage tail tape measure protein
MAYSQKGITININGNATGFDQAMRKVKADVQGVQGEMSKLSRALKTSTNDYALYIQQQALAADRIGNLKSQMQVTAQAIEEMTDKYNDSVVATGATSEQSKALARQLNYLKSEYALAASEVDSLTKSITEVTYGQKQFTEAAEKNAQNLSSLQSSATKAGASFSTMRTYMQSASLQMQSLNQTLTKQQNELVQLSAKYDLAVKSEGEFSDTAIGLKAQMTALEGSIELTKQSIQDLAAASYNGNTSLALLDTGLKSVAATAESAYKVLKPLSTISFAALAGSVASAVSYEDAWAGVTKTVSGTTAQMNELNEALQEMATSTSSSYEDLASYAQIAGQMGVATENIEGFTKTVAMLSDTTNVVGEDAAKMLSQFANVMVPAEERTTDYYERLGSALVYLGNNASTTESDIASMAEYMAPAARQVGLTTQETLALSTALSSMGIKATSGGSSMSKMLKSINLAVETGSEDLQQYAEVAGMSADEFAAAWKDDAGTAFAEFVEGIGSQEESITEVLDELGITEVRQSASMGALAQSTDLYREALENANSSWEENTALVIKANKQYETAKSKLSQTWESIKQLGASLGNELLPTIKDLLDDAKDWIKNLSKMDEGQKKAVVSALLIGSALAPLAKTVASVAKAGSSLIDIISKASSKSKAATAAIEGMDTASMSTFTTIAGGVAIVASIGAAWYAAGKYAKDLNDKLVSQRKAVDETYAAYDALIDEIEDYEDAAEASRQSGKETIQTTEAQAASADRLVDTIATLSEKENLSYAEKVRLATAIEQLNEIYPELEWSVDSETGLIKDNTGATIENTDALRENYAAKKEAAMQQAYLSAYEDLTQAAAEQRLAFDEATEGMNYYASEQQSLIAQQDEMRAAGDTTSDAYKNVCEQLQTTNDMLEQYRSKVEETWPDVVSTTQESLEALNRIDTGGLKTLGDNVIGEFERIASEASEKGVEIPEGFAEGIRSGTADPQEAIALMASLDTLNSMVDESGRIGGLIPVDMANGILESAPNMETAMAYINRILDFSSTVASTEENVNKLKSGAFNDLTEGLTDLNTPVETLANKFELFSSTTKQAMDEATSAVTNSTIDSEAETKGKDAGDKYETGINKVKTSTSSAFNAATSAASGSNVDSTAGSKGTSASSQYNSGISQIGPYTTSAMGAASTAINNADVSSAASAKGVQAASSFAEGLRNTLANLASTIKSAYASAASASSSSMIDWPVKDEETGLPMFASVEAGLAYHDVISRAGNYVASATGPDMSFAKSSVSQGNAISAFSAGTDAVSARLAKLETLVTKIADRPVNIILDGKKVGGLIYSEVDNRISRNSRLKSKIAGGTA